MRFYVDGRNSMKKLVRKRYGYGLIGVLALAIAVACPVWAGDAQAATKKDVELFIDHLLSQELNYFSSMISNQELGKLISIANRENNDELKGQKFIELLNL